MELLFVGTGAADYASVFTCPCHNCATARRLGGRNVRSFASLLIDRTLLVDCGATVPWRLCEEHADPSQITDLLVTHAHEDHCDPAAVAAVAAARRGLPQLRVFGNALSVAALEQAGVRADLRTVKAGQEVAVGSQRALALPAQHGPAQDGALNWLVATPNIRLLYACDTAWPGSQWWELVAASPVHAVVLEATFGPLTPQAHPDCLNAHLNWEAALGLVNAMRTRGLLLPDGPAWATHLSQHFTPYHDQYAVQTAESSLILAFDGLRVCL